MTSYAVFQWAGSDELLEVTDIFCGMIEVINPLAEINIKEIKSEGKLYSVMVFVEGLRAKEIDHLKTQAIRMFNRRLLEKQHIMAGVN